MSIDKLKIKHYFDKFKKFVISVGYHIRYYW